MRNTCRSRRSASRFSAVLAACGFSFCATAQMPTSVDIDLVDNSSADSLEVRLRSNGSAFSDLVTGLTFTIQWPSTSAATLGGRTMPCFDGIPLSPTPQQTDGAYHYVTYNAFSVSLLSDACPGATWPADEWVTLMRVKVNGVDDCLAFNVINDAWTAANNRDFYVSLNGLEKTGTLEATPDSVGFCGVDCEGVQGGAALPGAACDDDDVCTVDDLWSVDCACTGIYVDGDSDGTCDAQDGCPLDPDKVAPGLCGCGTPDTDTDGDLTPDCQDDCPLDPLKTNPGSCGCGNPDTDTDGDTTPDCLDGCPEDPLKTGPGFCGCGTPETDSDSDTVPDCIDGCPADPDKTAPGVCGCGVSDVDTDGDLTADCQDGCPNDPLKTLPGVCGCGTPDVDTDADGTPDCTDGCPNDPDKTAPGICGCANADTDSDGDNTPDCNDDCPNDPAKVQAGNCGCGNPEPGSACDDGDGTTFNDQIQGDCTCAGAFVDCNDQDTCTTDSYDGSFCVNTPIPDTDGDGACDLIDGCPDDADKTEPGACGCGVADVDTDGDLSPDCVDGCPADPSKTDAGVCGCGVPDTDTDGDLTADCLDGCPSDPDKIAPGLCGCGVADADTDSDGVPDCSDNCPTTAGQVGSPCDDGNANTTNDALNDQCVCSGLPANDGCFDATEIQVQLPGDCPANGTTGDNSTATPDGPNTLCDLDGFLNDVWYVFNSGDNTDITIDLDPGTMSAWGIAVYPECNATDIYCQSGANDPFAIPVTPNTPYLVRVYYAAWFGQGGTHSVCVSAGINLGMPAPVVADWSVYPNPNGGSFNVRNLGPGTLADLRLIDIAGRTVWAQRSRVEAQGIIGVDRTGIAPGVYSLRVRADGRSVEKRVVVE